MKSGQKSGQMLYLHIVFTTKGVLTVITFNIFIHSIMIALSTHCAQRFEMRKDNFYNEAPYHLRPLKAVKDKN